MRVWVGNHGDYVIPDYLKDTLFTKSGWPDKRGRLYAKFMEWAKDK